MINSKNIARHELIGLYVEISESTDPTLLKIQGKIIDETKNTLTIEVQGKRKKIPKEICIFRFTLNEGFVEVPGKMIVGRPQDRIKK